MCDPIKVYNNKMSTSTSKIVEPPDKNSNSAENVNQVIPTEQLNTKNFRPRSKDDDLEDEVFDDAKRVKSDLKAKTTVGDLHRKSSFTLLKKSILDTNPFAILDPDASSNDLLGRENCTMNNNQFRRESHPTKRPTKQRIPPVVITKPFKNPKDAISNITKMMKKNVSFKILKEGYSVTLESLDDHNTMKEFLAQQKIPFYTYTTLDKKPVRLVLKGIHHSYSPEDIAADLETQNVKTLSIQPMFAKGKVNMDMFIVNFEQGTKIAELTKTIKYVCHQTVTWQQFIKKDKGTQCRKCQRFGHAATNCGLEYRCVKCTHRHAPGDCPLEDDQPATCVNCSGNHPASYKKCTAYTKYAESLTKFQKKSGNNRVQVKIPTNDISSNSNAKIKSGVSYSQVLKSTNQSGCESNLNFLTNEINSLFSCSLSDLLQKVQNFVPEYKKQSDPMIKKILIIDFLSQFT